MKLKLIKIDTNGENASKFRQNLELYDLIIPNIIFLVDFCNDIFMSNEFDWDATRQYFGEDSNGHCIYNKKGSYTAAYDFSFIGIKVNEDSCANTLSELCDELSHINNINSWISKHGAGGSKQYDEY